jgi:L-2-hydroxyglutarate oxidase LhgO
MIQTYRRAGHNGIKLLFILMSLIFPSVAGMVPQGFSQTSNAPRKERDPSVQTVRFLLQMPPGFSLGGSEKQSARLGDRVSTALLKIFKKNELEDPENIRKFLPIIHAAFLYPTYVPTKYRKPKVTLSLLARLERKVTDVKLKHEISDVTTFVTEQARPHKDVRP